MGITNIEVLTQPDVDTFDQNPIHSHIIDRGDDPRPAEAIILEARVMGTPLTALCGYTWVPSRDPQKYPVCQQCAEIYEFARDFRGI